MVEVEEGVGCPHCKLWTMKRTKVNIKDSFNMNGRDLMLWKCMNCGSILRWDTDV